MKEQLFAWCTRRTASNLLSFRLALIIMFFETSKHLF